MATRYLVPCSCGEQLKVEATQAGLSVTCRCGAATELPTLAGLRQYPLAETEAEPSPKGTWGARQGLLALGLMLIAASFLAMLLAYLGRPREVEIPAPDHEELRRQASQFSPTEAWEVWKSMPRELEGEPHTFWQRLPVAMRNYRLYLAGVGTFAAVGVILITVSRFVKPSG